MKSKFLMSITIVLSALLLFVGCKPKENSDNKPTIMVTIEPLRYFADKIVGDNFNVVSMVPQGNSPETYDPTPQQLVALTKSMAYIKIGYIGFELSWMDKLLENAPNLKVFDSSTGIDLIYAEGHHHGDHYHAGGVEPHTWNSTKNANIIAKNILDAVIELDPQNKELYQTNYKLVLDEIETTDTAIKTELSNPNAAKGFMIYHPALSYFARDYGLTQVSIEENGKEPTPAHLKKLIETCKDLNIHIIFIQPEFDKKNAEVIAYETESKVIPINPLAYDWSKEMITTAEVIAQHQ